MICDRKLEMKSLDLAGVNITRTQEGLYVEVGSKDKDYAVYFKYDGSYERMKKWNSMYVRPLSILKECPKCIPKVDLVEDVVLTGIPKAPSTIILKARSVGMTTMHGVMSQFLVDTTLKSLKDKRCAYTFDLFGDAEGNFDCQLNWEDISFHTKREFHQIKTNFKEDTTSIKSGAFNGTLDDIIRMNVPAVKTNTIPTTDKLIEKIKLYNLFS